MQRIIRVFPEQTPYTPTDDLCFFGKPDFRAPKEDLPVHISVVFSWNKARAEWLRTKWEARYTTVLLGGPAYDDPSDGEFVGGRYVRHGITFTSRGCIRACSFCQVVPREGKIRELKIVPGNVIGDNNLLACSRNHIIAVFEMLKKQKAAVFSGGLDARLLKQWHIDLFRTITVKEMFFACDSKKDLNHLRKIAPMLDDWPLYKKRCFVLMGFEDEHTAKETWQEADARAQDVLDLGFLPFAQYYQPPNSSVKLRPPTKEWKKTIRVWSRPAATVHRIKNNG